MYIIFSIVKGKLKKNGNYKENRHYDQSDTYYYCHVICPPKMKFRGNRAAKIYFVFIAQEYPYTISVSYYITSETEMQAFFELFPKKSQKSISF